MSFLAHVLRRLMALFGMQEPERPPAEPTPGADTDDGETEGPFSAPSEMELAGGDADRLGRNFSHLTYEFLPTSPFSPESLDEAIRHAGPVDGLGEGEWEWDIQVVDSKSTLVKSFAASANAYGAAWGVKVEGSAGFLNEIEIDRRTLLVVASARKEVDRRGIDVSRLALRPELAALMAADPARFYRSYGSYAATQIARGGWMTLVFRRTFSTFAQKTTVEAKLRAAGLAGGGSAEARGKASTMLAEEGFTASARGVGGDSHAPASMDPAAAFAWVTDTWMRSLNEATAKVIGVRLAGLWLMEPPNPSYGAFLDAASRNTDEATQARLDLDAIAERAGFAAEDPAMTADQKKRLADLSARAGAAGAKLARSFAAAASPLDRPAYGAVLGDGETPEALAGALADLLREPRRELVTTGKYFLLRTCGENEHYVAGHDGGSVLTSPSRAQAAQLCFHTKGAGNPARPDGAIWVGDRVRLNLRDGDGDKHIMRAPGRNRWIELTRGVDPDRTWIITRKDGPPGERAVFIGDMITLVNAEHAGMTLKSRQKGRQWRLQALGFISHFQKIEPIG